MEIVPERVKSSLSLQIIIGIVLGLIAGVALGKDAAPLGDLGKLVITLIKTVAAPLIFFAVLEAILGAQVKIKHGLHMVSIAALNATIACALALLIANVLQPGKLFAENFPVHSVLQHSDSTGPADSVVKALNYTPQKIDLGKTFAGFFPTSIVGAFAENNLVQIVIVALFLGAAVVVLRGRYGHAGVAADTNKMINRVRTPEGTHLEHAHAEAEIAQRDLRLGLEAFTNLTGVGMKVSELVLSWILKLIPFAIFGVIARTTGEYGFGALKALGLYFFVVLGALSLHAIVVYQAWIHFVSRVPIKEFWKAAFVPMVNAMGSNSSLATLPLTLKALDRLGVSKASSRLGACVGTNLNNDGILLYEVLAALFIAQAFGVELSLGDQIVASLLCMVAALGVAGVPEAGIISLSIVLTTLKLPLEILPVLLTVDWILGRVRSVVNVLSDMVVSASLDRFR